MSSAADDLLRNPLTGFSDVTLVREAARTVDLIRRTRAGEPGLPTAWGMLSDCREIIEALALRVQDQDRARSDEAVTPSDPGGSRL